MAPDKLTPEQTATLESLSLAGIDALVAWAPDLTLVRTFLRDAARP